MPQIAPALQAFAVSMSKTTIGKFILKSVAFLVVSKFAAKFMGTPMGDLAQELEPEMSSMPDRKIVYGYTRVSGSIVYLKSTPVYITYQVGPPRILAGFNNSDDDFLHMVMEIAGHSCESIDEIYLDDDSLDIEDYPGDYYMTKTKVISDASTTDGNGNQRTWATNSDFKSYFMAKLYTGDQTLADGDLEDACTFITDVNERWDDRCIGTGKTYAYLKFSYNPSLFPGLPRPSFEVRGKNDIRDPRCDVVFTANEATETFTATGHGMSNGDVIQVTTDGSLPTGLAADTDYYVINKTTDTFQLSTTRGGSVKTISTNGTGTHTIDHQGGYRDNPALCLADYMTLPWEHGGIGDTWDQIDETALIAAANTCDDLVEVHDDATTQKRYVLSGRIITGDEPASVINDMLSAMAGWMERINGKWQINAGTYSAPTQTITESEMRSRPEISLNQPINQVINEVRPIIRSALTSWEPAPGEGVSGIQKIAISSVNDTTDVFNATGHGLVAGDRVRFFSWDGSDVDNTNLPGNIVAGGWYYVVNPNANDFQVSLTSGGSAVDMSSSGSGVVAEFDRYFTQDGERITEDLVFRMVSDETRARRLARIFLLQSRAEVSAKLYLKFGTAFCEIFDMQVGDSIRWIDAHRDFWEYTASTVSVSTDASGTITSTAHGLSDGQPIVMTDADVSGFRESYPYYVINSTTNTFEIANYRGGSKIVPDEGSAIEYRTIQGKLFRVAGWSLVNDGGALGVDLEIIETTADLYEWDSDYEVAPTFRQSITVKQTKSVDAPTNLAVTSGTNVLYTKQDGTIQSRAKLAWDATSNAFVSAGGYVDIQYRQSSTKTFTVDTGTDVFTSNGHGLNDDDIVRLSTTGTLPTGDGSVLSATTDYVVISATTNTFKLSNFFNGTAIDITTTGSGTHTVSAEKDWVNWGDVDGTATEAYVTDVQDGQDYDFRIRFRNSFGAESDWDEVLSHTVVGKTAAPGVPTGVTTTAAGAQGIKFSWTNPSDLDLDNISFYFSRIDNYVTNIQETPDIIITNSAHGLSVDDVVYFSPTDTSSSSDWNTSGLSVSTPYYVKTAPTTTTFTISETQGGSTYDFTGFYTTGNLFNLTRYADAVLYGKAKYPSTEHVFNTVTPGEKYFAFAKAVDTTGNESDPVSIGYASTDLNTYPFRSISSSVDPIPTYFSDYSFGFYSDKWDSSNGDGSMIWYGQDATTSTINSYSKNYINNGSGTGTTYCFKRATSTPSVPTGTTYAPTGWSNTPPSGTDRLWVAIGSTANSPNWYTSVRELETPGGYVPETI